VGGLFPGVGVDGQDGAGGPGRDRPGSGARKIEPPNEGMRSKSPQGMKRQRTRDEESSAMTME
jgi:hypothetical protein